MLICVIPSLSRVILAGSPTMTILVKKSGDLKKRRDEPCISGFIRATRGHLDADFLVPRDRGKAELKQAALHPAVSAFLPDRRQSPCKLQSRAGAVH